ncbi:MAG: response regulator, partial [Longimicrobiales bacterium]
MRGAFDTFQQEAAARLSVLRDALDKAREHVDGAEATVRRVARSVARAAEDHGLSGLEQKADNLADSTTRREMFARARVLLDGVDAGPEGPQRTRILVIEDEPTTALLLQALLGADDRTVSCVDTAHAALAALDDEPADLILLDLVLPDADGRDFLLHLRERPASADTPVVVMS